MAPPGLTPHARPLRRAADEVQFGACPEHGLVLSGLDEVEAQALLGLSRCPSLLRWQQEAVQHGVSQRRLTQFIRVLGERGLLDPAGGAGSTRSRSHVCVLGQGLLPSAVRSQLELAGVGTVSGAWPLPPRARPDLVVLVVADAVGAAEATMWQRHALPHLPVISRAHDIIVGPLVVPGTGPCLHCLDRHRSDRDRAWPRVLLQLAPDVSETAADVGADPALSGTAAGLATMVTQSYLDGLPVPPGSVWELSLPWPRVTTRRWSPHPACPCQERLPARG
jgi:bacteriocin biosynthesis cyclodehydratase domain-containing protein